MNNTKPPNSESRKVARELAALLGEKHHGVIGQISRIIRLCGVDFAREMYAATLDIEAKGGMMVSDNTRRRTPGGVFLHLVYDRLDDDQRKQIFTNRTKQGISLFSWKKRIAIIEKLQAEPGAVQSLTVTLRGRVEHIEKRAEVVVISLIDETPIDNLPRVLPRPPSTPARVIVYVTPEQWEKLEATRTNPSDRLIIEGTCAFDPETKSVVVFATSVQAEILKTKSHQT